MTQESTHDAERSAEKAGVLRQGTITLVHHALEGKRSGQRRLRPAREGVPGVPEDLNALCIDLLRRDPAARPSGREVLRRLASAPGEPALAVSLPPPQAQRTPLLGREPHLAALSEAFAAMKRRRTVLLYVHGNSGMGKSALLQHFLDGLCDRHEAVVLAGRCYEQESVPYKALDGLVDALSRYLCRHRRRPRISTNDATKAERKRGQLTSSRSRSHSPLPTIRR